MRKLFWRLRALFSRSRKEAELDEEIRFHLEMEAAENRRRGMAPPEAARAARLSFGGVEKVKAAYRDEARLPFFETFSRDALYALRRMAKDPAFTGVVLLTLALGIGATSALWSVVDGVLLRPLPYPRPDLLTSVVLLGEDGTFSLHTEGTFQYLRQNASSFEFVAATSFGSGINLAADSSAEYIDALRVSADYFSVLGVSALQGRGFRREEEKEGGPAVAVVSHALWQRHFDGAENVVGRSVDLGGEPHTVVGVMPPSFRSIPHADVWRPLRSDFEGGGTNLRVLARRVAGTTLAQTKSELDALGQWPQKPRILDTGRRLHAVPYRDVLTRGLRTEILVLFGAVTLLFLIACSNVACLLLIRAVVRRREMALRSALGGGRQRLLHQLLTESLVLALLGGALGVAFAHAGVRGLTALAPSWYLDGWQIGLDLRVLGATLALSLLTGFLFGLAPAFEAVRPELREALAEGGHPAGGRRSAWTRRGLVVFEVALSVLLLIGAGLLIRTLGNLRQVELGFSPERVLTAQMSFEGGGYADPARFKPLYRASLERIRRLPGVEAAAVSSALPVERGLNLPVRIPSSPKMSERTSISWNYVSPDYFDLLRIPRVAGRGLGEKDTAAAPQVAVVNRAFARYFFGQDEVEVLRRYVLGLEVEGYRIVGVYGDVKDRGLVSATRPTIYVPMAQVSSRLFEVTHRWFPAHWLVRLREGGGSSPIPGISEAVRSVDPRLPFSGFRTMPEVVAGAVTAERFQASLLGVFAVLALIMAAAGLYGLLSYSVVQRTREIGLRIALGSTRTRTLGLVVREGLGLAAGGIVLGCAGALVLARLLEGFVFGVSATDPATYLMIVLGFLLVAAAASAVPGMMAVRLDPVTTLRQE